MVGRGAACVLCCIIGGMAMAQDLIVRSFFGQASGCYRQDYSAGHLQRYPQQQVRAVAIWPDLTAGHDAELTLQLNVWTRDAALPAKARAACAQEDGRLICTLEEDQGTFALAPAPNDGLRLYPVGDGVAMRATPTFIVFRGRDGAFLLPPAPRRFCEGTGP